MPSTHLSGKPIFHLSRSGRETALDCTSTACARDTTSVLGNGANTDAVVPSCRRLRPRQGLDSRTSQERRLARRPCHHLSAGTHPGRRPGSGRAVAERNLHQRRARRQPTGRPGGDAVARRHRVDRDGSRPRRHRQRAEQRRPARDASERGADRASGRVPHHGDAPRYRDRHGQTGRGALHGRHRRRIGNRRRGHDAIDPRRRRLHRARPSAAPAARQGHRQSDLRHGP